MAKKYAGQGAVRMVEKELGRPLTYPEKRVVEEEGYVAGDYRDHKGVLTSGVGQTNEYRGMSFEQTFKAHEKIAKRLIKDFDQLPERVQGELVQAAYRGDLQLSTDFRKLFNQGKYAEAADEFLDNDDYRASKKMNESGKPNGVQGRMDRVADAVRAMKPKKKAKPGMLTGGR
jgi:GH24 family phage-related lysozyme (muramidase)